MTLQEACEEMKRLLERDLKLKGKLLSNKEFSSINKILLELDVKGMYECK